MVSLQPKDGYVVIEKELRGRTVSSMGFFFWFFVFFQCVVALLVDNVKYNHTNFLNIMKLHL